MKDESKLHDPCLVEFSKLPEQERNQNLQMAQDTLKWASFHASCNITLKSCALVNIYVPFCHSALFLVSYSFCSFTEGLSLPLVSTSFWEMSMQRRESNTWDFTPSNFKKKIFLLGHSTLLSYETTMLLMKSYKTKNCLSPVLIVTSSVQHFLF